jgi:hypothetical protein
LKNSLNALDEEYEAAEVTQAASMPLKRIKRESRSLTNILDALEEEKETIEVTDKQPVDLERDRRTFNNVKSFRFMVNIMQDHHYLPIRLSLKNRHMPAIIKKVL